MKNQGFQKHLVLELNLKSNQNRENNSNNVTRHLIVGPLAQMVSNSLIANRYSLNLTSNGPSSI